MVDTQTEILAHISTVQAVLRVVENAVLDGPLSVDMALDLRQRIEGAMRRMRIVRDWLDHAGE